MTSSLRNSLHRRNHKERSQLSHRAKLGILEKHKDYVLRARDYHNKQDRLTRLRQKASERNKDEFYFSMNKERTKAGVHVQDRGNVALPTDMVRLLKTQDENYVRTQRAAGQKKIDQLKSQLSSMANLLDDVDEMDPEELEVLQEAGVVPKPSKTKPKSKRRHVIFVDDGVEAQKSATPSLVSEPSVIATEHPQDLGWISAPVAGPSKKRKASDLAAEDSSAKKSVLDTASQASAHRKSLLRDLAARLYRDKQLRYTEREFEMQRLMMGKGARKKLKGIELVDGQPPAEVDDEDALDARKGKSLVPKQQAPKTYSPRVYKWKPERRR
ncbi:small-subunit processome [Cylindrobasidium torrendii FP15055 ss-10]|uniref:Small-subunit processome n=1 Tax=Cylindrobasidium torrendii FP15055 ss-10 TaxID=1314674 RepID=A0A0D7AYH3_9AGAR|nr:small-subunit processome [Cylindrobasidium torrendii FP15055 ss-10]